MNESQTSFAFYADIAEKRLEYHRGFDDANPKIKPLLIAALRHDMARFGRCSMQRAIEALRIKHGIRIGHDHRAIYAREIKSDFPAEFPRLRLRRGTIDSRRAEP